jgi:hypothetical protein
MTADGSEQPSGADEQRAWILAAIRGDIDTPHSREYLMDVLALRAAGKLDAKNDADVLSALALRSLRDAAEQGPPSGSSYTSLIRDRFRAFCDYHGLGPSRHILGAILLEADHRNGTWPRLTGRQRQPAPKPLAVLADDIVWPVQPIRRALADFERKGIVLYKRSRGAGSVITAIVYPLLVHLPPDQFERAVAAIAERVEAANAERVEAAARKSARDTSEAETLPSETRRGNAKFAGRNVVSDASCFADDVAQSAERKRADPEQGPSDECPECLHVVTEQVDKGQPVDNEPVEPGEWWEVS